MPCVKEQGRACTLRWDVRIAMTGVIHPQLLDLRGLGEYLGRPWRTLERQLLDPPAGFPPPVRFGRRVFWPRVQIDAWLRGVPLSTQQPDSIAPVLTEVAKRPRGRPRNAQRESAQ